MYQAISGEGVTCHAACVQAPVNAVALWSVPTELRPLAMSLSVVVIHLLGDVPSPPLLGWLQDYLRNWR